MKKGQEVYSKRISWGESRGSLIKEKCGSYVALVSSVTYLVYRKAKYSYHCTDCGKIINKGEMHGGTFYDHFCENCITETRPETIYQPIK